VTKDGQPHVPNTPVDQASFSFVPNLAGTYLITLAVTDKDGGVGMVSRQVVVVPPATPSAPTGLGLTGSTSGILLDWSDNTESDLAGYNVYRSGSPNGTYTKINTSGLIAGSTYNDATAPENANSYYRVTAVDSTGNESSTDGGGDGVGSAYRPPTYSIPNGGVVYEWNFLFPDGQVNHGATASWSPAPSRATAYENTSFTLTLGNLPQHSGITVNFGGSNMDSDYASDPDHVTLSAAGQSANADNDTSPLSIKPMGASLQNIEHVDDSLTITIAGSGYSGGDIWFAEYVQVALVAPPAVSIGKVQDGSEDPDPAGPNPPDEGPKPVIFSIGRSGGLGGNANALTVHLDDPSGPAREVEDYESLPDSVTIPAGAGQIEFEVTPKDDGEMEPTETLILRLKPDPNNVYALAQADPKAGAVIADNDYDIHLEIDRLNAAHVSDAEEHWGAPVNGYASSVFRVQLLALNYSGQMVEVSSGVEQTYTLDLDGAGGTISQVVDSAGHNWSINGSTASYWTDEPLTGTTFDVAVTFSFTAPGVKEVTLQGNVTAQNGPVVLSGSSKGTSKGRAIAPAPSPGAHITPPAIYHILDQNGAGGNGHSAVIIPTPNGCMYYSYSTDGLVLTMNYNNIDDALTQAREAGYTHYQKWNGVNAQEAASARNAAMAFHNTEYRLTEHNCWNMVFAALKDAGTNAGDFGDQPNMNYYRNGQGLADENGELLEP
jgi:hypothetical protein